MGEGEEGEDGCWGGELHGGWMVLLLMEVNGNWYYELQIGYSTLLLRN